VGSIVLGHYHEPGRVLVEAMHDPRPLDTTDARQVLAVMEQGVDQGARGVARGRMNDHPGRLVEHEEITVLVDDIQGYLLGLDLHRYGRRLVDNHLVTGSDEDGRPGGLTVPGDAAAIDQTANV